MYLSGIELVLFVIGLVLCGILCTLGCIIAVNTSGTGKKCRERRDPTVPNFDLNNPINKNAIANQTPGAHDSEEWYLREWRE